MESARYDTTARAELRDLKTTVRAFRTTVSGYRDGAQKLYEEPTSGDREITRMYRKGRLDAHTLIVTTIDRWFNEDGSSRLDSPGVELDDDESPTATWILAEYLHDQASGPDWKGNLRNRSGSTVSAFVEKGERMLSQLERAGLVVAVPPFAVEERPEFPSDDVDVQADGGVDPTVPAIEELPPHDDTGRAA